ncbi:response regulator transcription factor [Grimontia sp. NTOU-MAR1]|uniref:response regulator transcription factor n=1 Tax=Grimontia sp. NTOU-MAR1 TaxID=3111011 RepID=UPI002DBA60F5|nr:LuxR C-terminal-related transcriptional regulator [Grimontia sp. NTOU-MAR1]WRV98595.1 LuxR C-terminal-related transcriptional regulator [Grimontia sp. NTOU-MAR1]
MLSYSDRKTLKRDLLDRRRKSLDGATQDAIAHLILELDDPNAMLNIATRFIGERLKANRVDAGLSSRKERSYNPTNEYSDATGELPSMIGARIPNRHLSMQTIWKSNVPIPFHHVQSNPLLNGLHDALAEAEAVSMIAVSVKVPKKDLAVLCIDQCDGYRIWTPKETEYIYQFSNTFLAPLLNASRSSAVTKNCLVTKAELQAVKLAAEGKSYSQIADKLHKSQRTIENQLRSARKKTGAQNQTDLVRRCIHWF